MTFEVRELPKAKADVRAIFEWLHRHSEPGAKAWLDAYDAALVRLESHASAMRLAIENAAVPDFELRQILFKTRRGRVYRAVYFIQGETVFVVRVRGPRQAPIEPDEIR